MISVVSLLGLVLVGVGLSAMIGSDPSDDDLHDDIEGDVAPAPVSADAEFLVRSGETLLGSEDADSFALDRSEPTPDGYADVTLSAGAGDDLIDLIDPISRDGAEGLVTTTLNTSVIDAGAGDDTIAAIAFSSEIRGGEGNDEITFEMDIGRVEGGAGNDTLIGTEAFGAAIFGNDGDDSIFASANSGEGSTVHGGAGNDTLSGSNLRLFGGLGDDLFGPIGNSDPSTGYGTSAYGGEGDDTFRLDASADTSRYESPNTSTFGEQGADSWEITVSPASAADLASSYHTNVVDGVARLDASGPGDFDPSEDVIVVDSTEIDGYALTTARLDYDGARDETSLILHYQSPDAPEQDVVVPLGAGRLDWTGISFVGKADPLVIPA